MHATTGALDRSIAWRQVDWPAPPGVCAVVTQRQGGHSTPPFASLNLARHVGDDPASVERNRNALVTALALPGEPLWLTQVHGARVLTDADLGCGEPADGACTRQAGMVLAILTADCLPVFLTNQRTGAVAIIHAGWRGIAKGIIESGVAAAAGGNAADVIAGFGPAIGQSAFEVGDEVREALMRIGVGDRGAFQPAPWPGKWYADIYELARVRLASMGVTCGPIPQTCTYTDAALWFSHRSSSRDGRQTGRMASLIWRSSPA